MVTTIYLATGRGVRVVSNSGGKRRCEVRLEGENVQCVAASPSGTSVYCGTFAHGVFRSEDGGKTWKASGLPGSRVMSLAVVRSTDIIFAGTEPSAVFRSDDGGESWVELPSFLDLPSSSEWKFPPRPDTHHVRAILPDPHAAQRLFVAVEAGALIRSEDDGTTWHDRVADGPLDTHTLIPHSQVPGRLYSAAGDGYFESLDSGATWQKIEDGLDRHRYCWSVAVSSADPEIRIMSAAANAADAHWKEAAHSFVYRRAKDGAWQELRDGLPEPGSRRAAVIVASVNEPGLFYLMTEGELYSSTENGESWQALQVEWSGDNGPLHALAMAVAEMD